MTDKKTTPKEKKPEEIKPIEETKEIRAIEKKFEDRSIAPQDAFGKMTRPQIELIKKTIAKGASDDELRLFIQVCKGAQLNPFLKQVHLVPRWDNKEGKEVRAIQVSIDGFRSIAESSGHYAGNDDPVYEGDQEIQHDAWENKKQIQKKLTVPTKATVTIYKIVDGQRYPFTATARWSEYYPGGKVGFQWHIRPYLMLGKCAEALALRKAFPKLLSGMYAQEEMDRTAPMDTDAQKIQKGFTTLLGLIEKCTIEELQDWMKKVEKSDKYTEDQKAEFLDKSDKKIVELKTNQSIV